MFGHKFYIEILHQFQILHVNLEYLHPLLKFRKLNVNLSVETAGSKQSLIENVGPVGGGKHYHTGIATKTIHLCKELIKCIFTLIIG